MKRFPRRSTSTTTNRRGRFNQSSKTAMPVVSKIRKSTSRFTSRFTLYPFLVAAVLGLLIYIFYPFNFGASDWDRIPTIESAKQLEVIRHQHAVLTDPTTMKRRPQPQLWYVGVKGLGHRLLRFANFYHTARIQNVPHVHSKWGFGCGNSDKGNSDIFGNLFGPGPLVTGPRANDPESLQKGKKISIPSKYQNMFKFDLNRARGVKIYDDMPSYEPFSCLRLKLNDLEQDSYLNAISEIQPFIFEQAVSHVQFYRQLRTLFRFNYRIRNFTKHYSFSKRLVLGVHVRTGNGEAEDLEANFLGFNDIDAWIKATALSLDGLAKKMGAHRNFSKPPLLFVATDETSVIAKLRKAARAYGFVTVSFPQDRPKKGASHEHPGNDDSACHASFTYPMIDSVLLGVSDAVIAGRHSSFTHSLPLHTVLADSITREKPPNFDPKNLATYYEKDHDDEVKKFSRRLFCESNISGSELDCYDDYFKWLWSEKTTDAMIGGDAEGDRLKALKQYMSTKDIRIPCVFGECFCVNIDEIEDEDEDNPEDEDEDVTVTTIDKDEDEEKYNA